MSKEITFTDGTKAVIEKRGRDKKGNWIRIKGVKYYLIERNNNQTL